MKRPPTIEIIRTIGSELWGVTHSEVAIKRIDNNLVIHIYARSAENLISDTTDLCEGDEIITVDLRFKIQSAQLEHLIDEPIEYFGEFERSKSDIEYANFHDKLNHYLFDTTLTFKEIEKDTCKIELTSRLENAVVNVSGRFRVDNLIDSTE